MSKGKVRKQVKVDFNNLGAQWDAIKDVVQPKLDAFSKGYYIGGGEVEALKKRLQSIPVQTMLSGALMAQTALN